MITSHLLYKIELKRCSRKKGGNSFFFKKLKLVFFIFFVWDILRDIQKMNPNAKEFVPMGSKPSKPSKTELVQQQLTQLDVVSSSTAENVLQPLSHIQLEQSLKIRAQKAKTVRVLIPTITNMDGLEQVAQIKYRVNDTTCIFEIFWDPLNNRAIIDNTNISYQYTDMTIRKLIHAHFDIPVKIIEKDARLDEPASYAPAIVLNVQAI